MIENLLEEQKIHIFWILLEPTSYNLDQSGQQLKKASIWRQ